MNERAKKIITIILLLIIPSFIYAQTNHDTLTILSSGGLMSTLKIIAPSYEQATGIHLNILASPSMGNTPESIHNRLIHHQTADVVVMVTSAMDPLIKQHLLQSNSVVDLADSYIAMAVKKGSRVPNIATTNQLKNTLLQAQSIAYSDSASGLYLSKILFKQLGIKKQLSNKSHMIAGTPVGQTIADGKVQIGFQQYSELLPIKGITIVGLLPTDLQKTTRYSVAITTNSQHIQAAKNFINYLQTKDVSNIIKSQGLTPLK